MAYFVVEFEDAYLLIRGITGSWSYSVIRALHAIEFESLNKAEEYLLNIKHKPIVRACV